MCRPRFISYAERTFLMPFTPHGKHLIAGDWIATDQRFSSEPAHGPVHEFSVGSVDLVNRACEAAEEAFWSFGYSTRDDRARFLDAIADEIEARAEVHPAFIAALPENQPDAD